MHLGQNMSGFKFIGLDEKEHSISILVEAREKALGKGAIKKWEKINKVAEKQRSDLIIRWEGDWNQIF